MLTNIGFRNSVATGRIVAIMDPGSAPIKRMVVNARDDSKLVDATMGRRTRSVIVTDSGHIVLSSVEPKTISERVARQ